MMPAYPAPLYPLLDQEERAEEGAEPVAPLVFIGPPDEKEPSMTARVIKEAEEEKTSTPVKVKVVAPYRVVHEGKPYVGGDVLEVPNDEERDIWRKSGWIEMLSEKEKDNK
jgi:hypothetical protein